MSNKITIPNHEAAIFTDIVAGLTRQGIAFQAYLFGSEFIIEITGY